MATDEKESGGFMYAAVDKTRTVLEYVPKAIEIIEYVPKTIGHKVGKEMANYMKYKHEWMVDDTKEPGALDDEKKQENNNNVDAEKIGILLIGNTGTGKSSLCQLLSGKKANIAQGPERGNLDVTTIQSIYNKNLYFIDTIGLQDSNTQWTDGVLLKATLKYMYQEGFRNIKILFCVAGDTDERKGPFSIPAEFIGNLKVDEGNNDQINNATDDEIWNSVLIIKKKGRLPHDIDGFSGVIAAAMGNGATKQFKNEKHVFGFVCTDWKFELKKNAIYEVLNKDQYEKHGFFTEDRARETIEKMLQKLPSFELKFKRQICCRCGSKGDSRYVEELCHTNSAYFHIKPLSRRHPGVKLPKHIEGISKQHRFVCKKHDGQKRRNHSGQLQHYHPGELKKTSVSRVAAAIVSLSLTEWAIYKSEDWHWWSCCNEWKGNASPCCQRWSCCERDPSNAQCTAAETWSCCNKHVGSSGCKDVFKNVYVYKCCDQPVESIGCEMVWDCCNSTGQGCKLYYSCCGKGYNAHGCVQKCVNCKVNWQSGPGCVATKN